MLLKGSEVWPLRHAVYGVRVGEYQEISMLILTLMMGK